MGVRRDLFKRNPIDVPITDFFGSVRPVEVIDMVEIEPVKLVVKNSSTAKFSKNYNKYIPPLVSFEHFMK